MQPELSNQFIFPYKKEYLLKVLLLLLFFAMICGLAAFIPDKNQGGHPDPVLMWVGVIIIAIPSWNVARKLFSKQRWSGESEQPG